MIIPRLIMFSLGVLSIEPKEFSYFYKEQLKTIFTSLTITKSLEQST